MIFYLLLFICVLLLWKYFTPNKDYWKKRNVIQVNGTVWEFLTGSRALAEIYKKIYDKYTTEPYIGTILGTTPTLIVRDLKNVQAVFSGNFNRRGVTANEEDVLADNVLFMNDVQRWKLVRQKITPVFTSMKLKNMFYIIDRSALDFVELLKDDHKLRNKPFNALYTYTTASIGASVFGIDTQLRSTMDSPFLDMAWKTVKPSLKNDIIFFASSTFPKLFKLLKLKFFGEHEEFFIGAMKKVLQERRVSGEKRHDFIDLCLELQKQKTMKDADGFELEATDELMAAQAFFFFLAGADTSANTMHFTLLELSNNPKILNNVHEEIDKVFQECDEKLTYNDVEKLQYLDMVINEAMRKYPPIGSIQRMCSQTTILPVGNLKIEKDVAVVIPVYAIQRDEKYFPNPELFDPERFSPENVSNIVNYTFLPFGEGNRLCLGARFARLQVKTGLAWLLRRFTLREQSYTPEHFERSFFSLRLSDAYYEIMPRN